MNLKRMDLSPKYFAQVCTNGIGLRQLYSTDKARLLVATDMGAGRRQYLYLDESHVDRHGHGKLFIYRDPRRAKEKQTIHLVSVAQAADWCSRAIKWPNTFSVFTRDELTNLYANIYKKCPGEMGIQNNLPSAHRMVQSRFLQWMDGTVTEVQHG